MINLYNLIFIYLISNCLCNDPFQYKVKFLDVPLDHFSYTVNTTFQMRYLINDSYVRSDQDPIFFYTGNEGNIETFAQNTGFMWELAEKLPGLLIFAEHRYYGQSLPFGNKSFDSPKQLGYLSSEQALADFADLVRVINPTNRPVITFGGSYGGMLAAWFRMKYEHLITGAISSSAPIFQFEDYTPCDVFNRILSSVFATAHTDGCMNNIRRSWSVMKNLFNKPEGHNELNNIFHFCSNLTDIEEFFSFLTDVYGNLAMVNYPYPANFLAPLPAYPVMEFCRHLSGNPNDTQLISSLQSALNIYSNYTGQTKCLDINSAYNSNLDSRGWDFQACTEMVMPMCSTGVNDMFPEEKWDIKKYSDECFKKFQVRPRERAAMTYYGDKSLSGASNIIFSNGLLDPWSGGGVLRSDNEKIQIIIIPESAHHLDLRSSNLKDPNSVIFARKVHTKFIKEWIRDHRSR